MKKLLMIIGVAMCAGCATVWMSNESRTMVVIENSSWYLFNCIPIASGNPLYPNEMKCVWFDETVTLDNNMRLLHWAMVKEGASGVKNLTSYITDENVFILLFQRHAYHTSAELTKE